MQVLVEQNATTTDGRFCSNYISTIKLVHAVTSIKQSPKNYSFVIQPAMMNVYILHNKLYLHIHL
jgi:hypothetical protein